MSGTSLLARETALTLRIGLPLAGAFLAQMAIALTDTVILGGLGPDALAIGGLAFSCELSILFTLQSALGAAAILVSQARGADRPGDVPALWSTSLLLTALLAVPAFALFSAAGPLLRLAGQPPELADGVASFVAVLRWCVPGAMLGLGLLRAFLPAIGRGALILPTTLAAVLVNAVLCWGLVHGAFGLPRMGREGAAWAAILTNSLFAAALLALTLHTARPFVRWARPRAALLGALLRLGAPIAGAYAVETGLFFAVALLIGSLGADALAAHQVVLTTISVAFMVPLGLSQAANVRVGFAIGAGDPRGARRAGLVAIALAALWELAFVAVELAAPGRVVALYLDPADRQSTAIALDLLRVAAFFQVADGVQCVAAGALRGRGDTTGPFLLASLAYWAVGFPLAYALAIPARLGPAGAWTGLAVGLTTGALLLLRRFLAAPAERVRPATAEPNPIC